MKILLLSTFFLLCSCTAFFEFVESETESFYPPHYIDVAVATIGLNERKHYKELKNFLGVDPRYVEWCAAYVNAILKFHGYPVTNSFLARSFLDYGEKAILPEPGDIVVLRRGLEWQGHVGFFITKDVIDGEVYYLILGGNQDNGINVKPYKASRVLGVRKVK
jgi:uncharacterized protein (TIGR02594 family)